MRPEIAALQQLVDTADTRDYGVCEAAILDRNQVAWQVVHVWGSGSGCGEVVARRGPGGVVTTVGNFALETSL